MFTNISWTNYFFVIISLLIIYYIIIGLRFYPVEIRNFLFDKMKFKIRESETKILRKSETGNTSSKVEELVVRLKDAIAELSGKRFIKQEFFLYLQLILEEYPEIKNSQFQSAINELIISECAKYDSIMFSEEELVGLWSEVA